MAVDLQPHVLAGEAEGVEELGVLLGPGRRCGRCPEGCRRGRRRSAARARPRRRRRGRRGRGWPGPGRRAARRGPGTRSNGRGPRRGRAPIAARRWRAAHRTGLRAGVGEVTEHEAQWATGAGLGLGQHGGRRVQADELRRVPALDQPGRQLAGAAAEIGHPTAGFRWLDQRDEVVERRAALGLEAVVLIGVPAIGHTCILLVLSSWPGGSPTRRSHRARRARSGSPCPAR